MEVTKLKHRDSNKEKQSLSKNIRKLTWNNGMTITYIFIKKVPHTAKKWHHFLFAKFIKPAGRLNLQRHEKIWIKRSNVSNSKYNTNFNCIQKTLQRTIRYHLHPSNNVINLTTKTFTFHEFKLSNKNLKFYAIPYRYNKKQFKNDIEIFIRKV